uniref:ATP synthase complex subunit 8 n=1 Tax=Pentatoma semiannulata TaxID=286669 RepID=A0A7M3UZR3_9HEMI|nr:ATP synthase F0 subunit 8 [Pentatoma semiannulata]QOL12466.1 ATP synthase F0 subunit 8 [Pentatoma semiannulata]
MPQMAPLWWEILFLMFLITFLAINILIYFINNKNINMNVNKNIKMNQFNWTW